MAPDQENFETEAFTIPLLKHTLRGADYSIKKWAIHEDEKGRTLAITAYRAAGAGEILPESEAQGEADGEE